MQAYVNYEKVLTGNKIIAILADTEDDRFKIWRKKIIKKKLLARWDKIY